jgi:uncharacterized protein (DUF433 family)
MANYKSIVSRNPNKCFGKPCIRETRISVSDVFNWSAKGMISNEILTDFTELTEGDILAFLSYAADREHKIELV